MRVYWDSTALLNALAGGVGSIYMAGGSDDIRKIAGRVQGEFIADPNGLVENDL